MADPLGRGPCGSLAAYVDYEIRSLARENATLRRARYSLGRRFLRAIVMDRSIAYYLGIYVGVLALALLAEWATYHYASKFLPGYRDAAIRGFLKDVGSYLIAAQIGILAIVSVAVGVVTLLSQRDDGASVNTDIRLYYVESYSYELAVSGVALLLVVTLQLFWPFQHLLHVAGIGGSDNVFKLGLVALHTLWFCLNLTLFLQFITTTLRFVEPDNREILRERYSANEIIPRDARHRLLGALYLNTARQMFGEEALRDGPDIIFGYRSNLDDRATVEVAIRFRSPVKLRDVRLRPLHWVLARWQQRVRRQPQRPGPFRQPLWSDHLTIALPFDTILQGPRDIVLRRGDEALTRFERWVLRYCFRFAAAGSRADDHPTPDQFLEQLVDKVVTQVEQRATSGFRAALGATLRYHRFILEAQNTKDSDGKPFNLAEVGGFFSRPDADWVHQYRRAFFAAADAIGVDTYFIDRLSNIAARLVPEDGTEFSQRVLQTLLQLGNHQIVAMEDWVTRRAVMASTAEPDTSTALAGSDTRAFENALIGFVGGWESLAQALITSLSIERRPSALDPDAQWRAFGHALPVFQTHLHNAAFFLASAVWNDDPLGADRLRDMLVRWLNPFYANLQNTYIFSNTLLLTPDIATQNWETARTEVVARMQFRQEAALPGPVSGIVLWELHCDVLSVAGLIALHWYATDQQPSQTAADTAIRTLRRQKREGDGSDLTLVGSKTIFRLLFDFAVRYALNPRFAEGRYSSTIDGLVRFLTNLAEPRRVAGRIYGGFGIDGFETLRPVFLAAMAANLPVAGDDGVAVLVASLRDDPSFAADRRVRDFIWTVRQMLTELANIKDQPVFTKAARAFGRDIDLATASERLRVLLTSVVDGFESLRKERLRTAPLDEDRLALVRRRMDEAALARGTGIMCFTPIDIRREAQHSIPIESAEFGVMDRGLFTLPQMSGATFEDLPGMFVEVFQSNLADRFWRGLYHRPKRVISISIADQTGDFWDLALAESENVGPDPILLVPYDGLGEQISLAAMLRQPVGVLAVEHDAGQPNGGGAGYLGSLEGLPIYSVHVLQNQAILCSRRILRAIAYGVVHGTRDIADFDFLDGDNPEASRIRLRFAQRFEWAEYVFVEFALQREPDPEQEE